MSHRSPRAYYELDVSGLLRARFSGASSLTEQNAEDFGRELDRLVEGKVLTAVSLDLGSFDFISSSGLMKFISFHKKLSAKGIKLVLHSLQPNIREVFEVSRLDQFVNVDDDQTAAAGLQTTG